MSDETRSAGQMVKIFKNDPALIARLKSAADPISVLEEAAEKAEQETAPWTKDIVLYRIAVGVLGALTLIAALGSIGLVAADKTTPEVLVALGSAAVGALVGLFAPSPSGK
jgi:hypothetical protein